MTIERYAREMTGELYLAANGQFVRYDDHHNEVVRLEEVINGLYDRLSEISELKRELKSLKPTRDSKFLVRNEKQDKVGVFSNYVFGYNHLLSALHHLGTDQNNVNIKVFTLTELPVVASLTVRLPE